MSITVSVELTPINCGACGGTYAINERFRAKCQADATCWNCPYCKCSWGYPGKTAAEKERERAEAVERQLACERQRHDQTRAELEHTEARRRGEKAAKTRLQRRIVGGACPCCKRTFTNLQRHMATKHPEFAKEASA